MQLLLYLAQDGPLFLQDRHAFCAKKISLNLVGQRQSNRIRYIYLVVLYIDLATDMTVVFAISQ